jgi:transposase
MLRGEGWYMVRELLRDGVSISEIARRTGHDRKTIRRLREQPGHPPARRSEPRPGIVTPYASYLRMRVAAGVLNATKLFQELQQHGYSGGVAQVRRFVRPLRAPRTPAVTERFETPPGWQAQVDWAACGRIRHDGAVRSLSAFVFTLGYSRRQYVEFTVRQDAETFLRCHLHAFRYFGGIPHEVLYDNLKTAVDHRTKDGGIVWNRRFRDFADTYGFTPRACQPYRAQTKGKVERGIRYLRGNFLLGRDLSALTLGGLNSAVLRWLRDIADVRVHGTTHERPADRWPAEVAALMPLGDRPEYDTSYQCQRLVSREGWVAYRRARYALDPLLAGQVVLVKDGDDGRVRIVAGDRLVADHPLASAPGQLVSTPDHLVAVRALTRRPRPADATAGGDVPELGAVLRWPAVEVRPLAAYDLAVGVRGG